MSSSAIKNVSEHYIGLLENDEISDAEIIDIGKAKPLAALAMDSEWGEEQLAKMTPALREVAQKEAIRQMSKVGHEFDQPAAEDARRVADCRQRSEKGKCDLLEVEREPKGGRGPQVPQDFIAKFETEGHLRLNEERKTVDKATLKQITSGKFQVNSVDPASSRWKPRRSSVKTPRRTRRQSRAGSSRARRGRRTSKPMAN